MKKIFLVALAAIGMTACMQDEVVEIANGGAIAFDNAFVGNATRAGAVIDNNSLTEFNVWGYVDNPTGVVFNETEVRGGNGVWNYEGTQYWMPNNEYWFAAVAPVTDNWSLAMETADNATRTLTFANDCVTDLVYASKYVEADDNYGPVGFTFAHLLSKVQFTVTTNLPNYSEATVDNLQIVTVKDATIDLPEDPMQWEWEPTTTETFQLNFNDDYFIVPAACEVSFDVTLKAVNSTNNGYKVTKKAILPADAFVMGHAYNLCAEINPATLALEEIVFVVEGVDDWTYDTTPTDADIYYAAQVGGTVTLNDDVVLPENLVIKANTTINLNNHSIKGGKPDSAEMTGTDIAAITVDGGALTIVGDGAVEGTEYGVYVKNGSVTIKGGEFKAGTSAVQVYNGTANIEGGKFSATSTNVYVVNCIDANWKNGTAKVNVTGGTFVGFNPADNAAEGAGTNFVAPYYKSTEDNGVWTVALDAVYTTRELQAAIDAGQAHINLAPNTTFEGTVVMKSNVTIEGLSGSTMHCVALNSASNITLKNITFDAENAKGSYDGNGKRVGWANIISGTENFKTNGDSGSNIVIDGCTFTGTFEAGGEAIAFTNQKRSVYGEVTIKNCTFETEGAYYHIYGHYFGMNELVIENNTFKTAVDPRVKPIYLNRYQSNNAVIIKNNTFKAVSTIDEAVHQLTHGNLYVVSFEATGNTFAN